MPSDTFLSNDTATDFAVAAYVDEGRWEVLPLPTHAFDSLHTLVVTLRNLPGQSGALALVSLADEVFLIVRVAGQSVRMLLSDAAAAGEWDLAADVLATLGVPAPDADDDDVQPAGDIGVLADLGISRLEAVAMCEDLDLYPDDVFARIAGRLGFRSQLDETLDALLR